MIVCEILGDWKWIKEIFKFEFWYGKVMCCHQCMARKDFSELSFVNFFGDATHRLAEYQRTHIEYVNSYVHLPYDQGLSPVYDLRRLHASSSLGGLPATCWHSSL